MSKKKKRTNPNRRPLAKQQAFTAIKHKSVDIAMAIIFQAALDMWSVVLPLCSKARGG